MDILNEKELTSKDRSKMQDKTFGLPDERKFPLNDEKHVMSAIGYFRTCPKDKRAELARNINAAIRKFHMSPNVSIDNPFHDYYKK
jgi:hypothetical protein